MDGDSAESVTRKIMHAECTALLIYFPGLTLVSMDGGLFATNQQEIVRNDHFRSGHGNQLTTETTETFFRGHHGKMIP